MKFIEWIHNFAMYTGEEAGEESKEIFLRSREGTNGQADDTSGRQLSGSLYLTLTIFCTKKFLKKSLASVFMSKEAWAHHTSHCSLIQMVKWQII